MCVQQFSKLCSFATSAKTHALTLEEHPGLTTGTTNQQCFVFSPSSFSVSILTSSPLSCHSASACHISPILDHSRRRYDVLSIFKMAAAVAQFYFRIRLDDVTFFRRSMSISFPNSVRITQTTVEIQLFSFCKNKRPPY